MGLPLAVLISAAQHNIENAREYVSKGMYMIYLASFTFACLPRVIHAYEYTRIHSAAQYRKLKLEHKYKPSQELRKLLRLLA